jgi:nucleotide-binding universal stress UspA family protein
MSYRTLLTHVVVDRGCTARLRMSVSVARALSVQAIGLGAQAPWPFEREDGRGGAAFERLVQSARADIATAETLFRDCFAKAGVVADWRCDVAYPNDAMTRHARAADIILAYRRVGGGDSSAFVVPDNLLMEAGVPVLFMPRREVEFKADAALFAWKNTREARRALSLGLPLLKLAKRVLVAAVCPHAELETVERELGDVVRRLQGHGVNASSLAEVDAPGAVGRRLLRIAQGDQIDLIVAGGFGHSRLREWVLGGVTRELLEDPRRYVLLSH